LSDLLRPQFENEIKTAALTRLKRVADVQVAKELVDRWSSFEPGMRIEVLNALLSRVEWVEELLLGVQSGKIPPGEVAPVYQQQLTRNSNPSVRERAQKLFSAGNPDRQKVLKAYEGVGSLHGNPQKGAALFRQNCAACHQFKGEGNSIGPDLGSVADKPIGTLVVAILDPNQAFESRYINYTAVSKDGREVSGIITAETPNSITIRNAGGKDEVILRTDLQEVTSSRLSLMPEGLESVLKPQDMADLIAFLRAR
jgi:putative heme-binding domain-containing protein